MTNMNNEQFAAHVKKLAAALRKARKDGSTLKMTIGRHNATYDGKTGDVRLNDD